MGDLKDKQTLQSRVLKTELTNYRDFKFIQQDDFKELTSDAKTKLKASILSNSFAQPFYVWQDPETGTVFCLDGKHRVILLNELSAEGHHIPELLPATYIACENINEAARLVLIYSSMYAKITQQGLFDFIEAYELEFADLKLEIDLPDFSTDRFEQKFDIYETKEQEEPEVVPVKESIVNPGDIFEINGHRILCGSFLDEELLPKLMNGKKARILNCDPPYNLPAKVFTNDSHTDFAMAAGEMTDREFVDFLSNVMLKGIENTVEGAIHYIYMDWRHVWHMTEAGRMVYGSPSPKQLCVWNKDLMANGSFYRPKHELCFIFSTPHGKALWNKDLLDAGGGYKDNQELCFVFKSGDSDAKHLSHLEMKDRIRTNVWNYPSAVSTKNPDRYALKDHPTPKPVQMIADSILDTTIEGDIIIDWFLGSGTCLIAAEQTNRICYATEIEPKFVQSAIIRYLNYCSKKNLNVNFTHLNGSTNIKDFQNAATN